MPSRPRTQLERERDFVAEADVGPAAQEEAWTPRLALEDAYKRNDVRKALRAEEIAQASLLAKRVRPLTPVRR